MSKKVFIGVGHGCSDPGAKDYIIVQRLFLVYIPFQ
jgi:N-acetylmuramoyl-L-alanine amidase